MTDTQESGLVKTESSARPANLLLWAAFCIFLICYTVRSLRLAAATPVWMDEVLTLWIIRLPSASQIYQALAHGAQFSPPVFHWALHYYAKLAGESYLALRAPTIAAVLLTGLCSFVIFRRYLGIAPAIFGCCLLLETIRPYGLEIRPYPYVTACFAAVLLLWDDFNRRGAWWRSVLIALLLIFAISMHVYSLLFLPCLGLIELIHSYRIRALRPSIWIALVAAGASTLLWLPLIVALQRQLAGYVNSPVYWGKPSIGKLVNTYSNLAFSDPSTILPILAAMSAIALARLYGPQTSTRTAKNQPGASQANFWIMMFGTALFPLVVFIFSLLVTGTFHPRYAVAGAIGVSALVVAPFTGVPFFRRAVPLIVLFMALLTLRHSEEYWGAFDRATVFQNLPGPYPIVVAEGNQFFPLAESAPPDIRSRLVYLTLPPEAQVPDRWIEHQVQLWKAIDPALPVESASAFLAAHPKFYVLDTRSADNAPATWLSGKHLVELTSLANGVYIYKSRLAPDSGLW